MFELNLSTELWNQVEPKGSPRRIWEYSAVHYFDDAVQSIVVLVFGGIVDSGYNANVLKYIVETNIWQT